MAGWLSVTSAAIVPHHEMAIRRFGPASLEQEGEYQQGLNNMSDILDELELWPTWGVEAPAPSWDPLEQNEFVDSFINMDTYGGEETSAPADRTPMQSPDELQGFSLPRNPSGDVSMSDGEEFDFGFLQEELVVASDVNSSMEAEVIMVANGVDAGLNLVHLLLACAEAVGCRDTKLANSILGQIWACVDLWGSSLQRVSYCFAMGLKTRISLLHNAGPSAPLTSVTMDTHSTVSREKKMEGFHLLHQSTPYVAFGFMAANDAICQAAQGKSSIHILDLGMEHTLQWPSLIRTLASRPEGPPTLRITAVRPPTAALLELDAGMRALVDEAASLGMSLEFRAVPEPSTPSLLNGETIGAREGETLFVNSIMHLHKYVKESRGSLKAFLQAIRKLGPVLLTVVEQDANHNGPFFLGRFLESLHYYSAIFDSLEASLPIGASVQRAKIERAHFAEEIENIIAYEGAERVERHERVDQWRRQLGRSGFQSVSLKCMSQARMMLSVYGCDGYTLASEKGCLLLGWKGRPIMLASAWQINHASSSS